MVTYCWDIYYEWDINVNCGISITGYQWKFQHLTIRLLRLVKQLIKNHT